MSFSAGSSVSSNAKVGAQPSCKLERKAWSSYPSSFPLPELKTNLKVRLEALKLQAQHSKTASRTWRATDDSRLSFFRFRSFSLRLFLPPAIATNHKSCSRLGLSSKLFDPLLQKLPMLNRTSSRVNNKRFL